ncbi:MAG: protein kinase domain-containing protein [Planctomycetota bacterium]|jgi:serine/threonine protein kinase/tetratricopeptide (TPR) repeat protein
MPGDRPDPDSAPTLGPEGPDSNQPDKEYGEPPSPEKNIGPYEILGEIGRGGMGIVYKAFHPALKRTVALKVLIAGEDASEEAIARFHREAEAVAKLGHHPNIVPVHDIGKVVGAFRETPLHYFAMHYVEGLPLDRIIDEGEITPKRAAVIAKKLAEALHHAHQHGVLHRDVKPSNVLMALESGQRSAVSGEKQDSSLTAHRSPFTAEFEPMLTDFGLAKDVESESKMTRSGMTLGTPAYMPPEQAEGHLDAIDERSDVYSLGATLYEMLVLQPPFEGKSVGDLVRKILFHEPVPPRKINRQLDKDLETICLKCLEKEPSKRYGKAADLAQDLGRFLEGAPIHARPASFLEKLVKRARRNKGVTIAVLVIFLLLCGGGVGTWLGVSQLASEKEGKEKAKTGEEKARFLLKKGRAVSKLLRLADVSLQRVNRDMRDITATPEDSPGREEKRNALWKEVEAFEKGVPSDSASRATWFAVKGWLRYQWGDEVGAMALFRTSRETDPEVAPGYLFEAMVWIVKYFKKQPMPIVFWGSGPFLTGTIPPETEEMKGYRARYETLLEALWKRSVWGDSAAKDFQAVVQGFRAFTEKDFEKALEGLAAGLALPEMTWMREEILAARAQVHHYAGRFETAAADLEEILRSHAMGPTPHIELGRCLLALGHEREHAGEDPMEWYEKAIQMVMKGIERDPSKTSGHSLIGNIYGSIAARQIKCGIDPRESFQKAIEAFSRSVACDPEKEHDLRIRGFEYVRLGRYLIQQGEDPSEAFSKALADLRAAAEKTPEKPLFLATRGRCLLIIGQYQGVQSEEGEKHVRNAVNDLKISLASDLPGKSILHEHLGGALKELAALESSRGRECSGLYEEAIEQFTLSIPRAKGGAPYHWRAGARVSWAKDVAKRGGDPRPFLPEVIKDLEKAIELGHETAKCLCDIGWSWATAGQESAKRGEDPTASYKQALVAFDRSLELAPGDAVCIKNRSATAVELAVFKAKTGVDPRPVIRQSIQDLEEIIRRDSSTPDFQRTLISLYSILAKNQEMWGEDGGPSFLKGVDGADAMIPVTPENWDLQRCKALLLEKLGRFSEAAQAYEEAYALGAPKGLKDNITWNRKAARAPKWMQTIFQARVLLEFGNYRKLRSLYEKALSQASDLESASRSGFFPFIGFAHRRLAGFLSILSTGKPALRLEPRPLPEAEAAALRKEALQHLRKAFELGWTDIDNLRKESDLEAIRKLPEFETLIKEWEKRLQESKGK